MVDQEEINKLIREWLDQAESELKSARKLLEANLFSQTAYHSYQAVEFWIKSFTSKKVWSYQGS